MEGGREGEIERERERENSDHAVYKASKGGEE